MRRQNIVWRFSEGAVCVGERPHSGTSGTHETSNLGTSWLRAYKGLPSDGLHQGIGNDNVSRRLHMRGVHIEWT